MPARWTVRRTRARRAVVSALAGVIALTTFLLTGIAGYSAQAEVQGLRDYLTAPGSGVALALQTRLGDDPSAQQAAANEFFASSFAGIDVVVFTSLTLPPQPVSNTSVAGELKPEGAPTVRLASFDGFLAHARITAGSWPADPRPATGNGSQPAALSGSAADALGVGVGDTVSIGNATRQTFRINAIWAPTREGDPFFEADAAAARSAADLTADKAAAGFLVVPRPVVAAKGSSAQANWTVVPNPDTVTPSSIPALARAAHAVPEAFRSPNNTMAPHGGLVVDNLSGPLLTVSDTLRAARAVNPVPSLLVAAIALVMTVQLARLLSIERRSETALVRSRGASAGQLTRIATIEAALIALPAALAGAVVAALGLRVAGVAWPSPGWWIWIPVGAIGATVIVLPAARQARTTANRQNIDDSGRIRALAAGSTVALVVIAAAIALWRFRHLGSAVVVGSDATTHLDPIAVLAPPLVLIAAAVIAGVAFGVLAAIVETVAAGLRGIGTVLAARQVARRATVYGTAVLLLAISVGGTALAASYAPTQLLAQQQTDALRNGAQVQVQLPSVDPKMPSGYDAPPGTAAARLPGVRAAVPGLAIGGSLGSQAVDVTALPTRRLGELLAPTRGFDPDEVAAALRADPVGLAIPDGTTALRIDSTIAAAWGDKSYINQCSTDLSGLPPPAPGPSGGVVDIDLTAWVAGPSGWATPVAAGTAKVRVDPTGMGTPQAEAFSITLPGLAPGSRLTGLYWTLPSEPIPLAVTIRLARVGALAAGSGAAPLSLGEARDWVVSPPVAPPTSFPCRLDNNARREMFTIKALTDGIGASGVTGVAQTTTVPLLPTARFDSVPIAIDRAAADLLDLSVGDQIALSLGSARVVPATVAVISPVLPGAGSGPAVLADLGPLSAAMLQVTLNVPATNRLWVATDDPAGVAAEIRPVVPATSLIVSADSRSAQALLTPASRTLWLGAIGATVLAIIGVGSVIAVVSRSRRGELVALRACGISARRQGRSRRRELFSVSVAGWLLGAAVGAVAVFTTVSALAGSTIVGSFGAAPPIRWEFPAAVWLIGAQVVVVAAIVVGHGRWLHRAVLDSTPSGRSQSERDRRPKGRSRRAAAEQAVEHSGRRP